MLKMFVLLLKIHSNDTEQKTVKEGHLICGFQGTESHGKLWSSGIAQMTVFAVTGTPALMGIARYTRSLAAVSCSASSHSNPVPAHPILPSKATSHGPAQHPGALLLPAPAWPLLNFPGICLLGSWSIFPLHPLHTVGCWEYYSLPS